MEKEVFIIRHGETELNRLRIVQGSGIDSELNEKGRGQAQLFHKQYSSYNFDFVYTSALRRTLQTVSGFILDGIPYKSLSELNEISWGTHEGKEPEPSLINAYNNIVDCWLDEDYDAALPLAESPNQMKRRLEKFVEELKSSQGERILVCTHGRALRCLMTILLDEPLKEMEKYQHSNRGFFKLIFKNGVFESEFQNCTDHLNSEFIPPKDW